MFNNNNNNNNSNISSTPKGRIIRDIQNRKTVIDFSPLGAQPNITDLQEICDCLKLNRIDTTLDINENSKLSIRGFNIIVKVLNHNHNIREIKCENLFTVPTTQYMLWEHSDKGSITDDRAIESLFPSDKADVYQNLVEALNSNLNKELKDPKHDTPNML